MMFIISQKPIETIGECLEEESMEEITYKNINAEDFARLELIEGVELGGVATFIGAGETSDISLFI